VRCDRLWPARSLAAPVMETTHDPAKTLDAARNVGAGYKVDVSRGQRIGRVSSEWFSRLADERYLSLSKLFGAVNGRAERSRTRTVESAAIRVEANRDDAERLTLLLPG
jgi:hypothetical protein